MPASRANPAASVVKAYTLVHLRYAISETLSSLSVSKSVGRPPPWPPPLPSVEDDDGGGGGLRPRASTARRASSGYSTSCVKERQTSEGERV